MLWITAIRQPFSVDGTLHRTAVLRNFWILHYPATNTKDNLDAGTISIGALARIVRADANMPIARLARMSDLERLLDLFRVSEVSSSAEPVERAERILSEMLARDGLALFVSEANERIAATCMLITAPNLLRGGRGHGFIENVVTHPEHRGRGHGRAVVQAALAEAWARDCHQVLLQSGRTDSRVHHFYESLGFEPGIRIGYVARRPEQT